MQCLNGVALQNVIDWDKFTIQGTSTAIFKPYLRLTTVCTIHGGIFLLLTVNTQAPDPAQIRPLSVLKETLRQLSAKWRQEPDYVWTCDQFKSLRQDLTVSYILDRMPQSDELSIRFKELRLNSRYMYTKYMLGWRSRACVASFKSH